MADHIKPSEMIAAYLDREADKTPRARVRARTLRAAASNIRAGLWREEEERIFREHNGLT